MKPKTLFILMLLTLLPCVSLFAQGDNLDTAVDNKVNKMQKALDLTTTQAIAIRPIIKNYLIKRMEIIKEVTSTGIVDHTDLKITLNALKDNEHKLLSKVLSPDQLEKWIDKENLLTALNPENTENADDEDATMTPEGASFKF